MKKVIFAAATILIAFSSYSQYDPEALAVLDAMSAKYKKIDAFEANFTQQMINESAGIDESIKGEISVKGDMYVLKVAGQEIYNNGVDVYSYSEELQEVTVSTFDAEEQEITLGNIYDLYKEGYKYVLMSTQSNGDRIVELDPESKDKSYHKIRLVIDKNDDLKKFTVFERSGNKYVYDIKNFKEVSLADSYFTFDTKKYPNVEVIDFR
ncbi:LolA family protein [Marinoscillum sp.]|uniref:LolA family protein n=1 Tax=Marinoscillum sp. TaxID=2024838 RepID=UPI003BAACAFC